MMSTGTPKSQLSTIFASSYVQVDLVTFSQKMILNLFILQ
jgi:hypothetical protein